MAKVKPRWLLNLISILLLIASLAIVSRRQESSVSLTETSRRDALALAESTGSQEITEVSISRFNSLGGAPGYFAILRRDGTATFVDRGAFERYDGTVKCEEFETLATSMHLLLTSPDPSPLGFESRTVMITAAYGKAERSVELYMAYSTAEKMRSMERIEDVVDRIVWSRK